MSLTTYQHPAVGQPLLRVQNVSHTFGSGETATKVLHENRLEVMPGELVIMSGPSGSGKTTLLTLIGGLRALQSGSIEIWDGYAGVYRSLMGQDEKGLVSIRRRIGFIFQRHNLFDSLKATQNIRMAQQLFPQRGREPEQEIHQLLSYLGLEKRAGFKPGGLSGGQRQRVAVARALVNRPKLILADEPTAALDASAGLAVITLLQRLAREPTSSELMPMQESAQGLPSDAGRLNPEQIALLEVLTREKGATSLIVTHDKRIMNQADRIVHMEGGKIVTNVVVAERLFVVEGLRRCGFFAAILPEQQQEIADGICVGVHPDLPVLPKHIAEANSTLEVFAPGDVILRQGEPIHDQSKFYLIRRGSVRVDQDQGSGPRTVARLGKQDFFGDRALVTLEPRNATVVAEEVTEVYTVGRSTFQKYEAISRPFIERIISVYGRR